MGSKRKVLLDTTTISTATTVNSDVFDVINYTVASLQLIIGGTGTLAGSFKAQASNDGVNFFDIPNATANLSTTSPIWLNLPEIGAAFVRGVITASSGSSVCTVIGIAKE